MDTGSRALRSFVGGFDLQSTLESGQTYLWRRDDRRAYQRPHDDDGDAWYYTALPASATETNEPEVLRVRQVDDRLEWVASTPYAYEQLTGLLRLDDDLESIIAESPEDDLLSRAYETYRGMRLVRDPPFACLISFICSAQMHVARIHGMQTALTDAYGEPVDFGGRQYRAYPTPEALAEASETALRELSLGYRAPYVQQTAEMVADGLAHPGEAADLEYEAAREWLTRFVGVGQKVADCVCLFSLGHLEAVPLDTWIRRAIAEHYPHCDRGSYAETSRAIRDQFGGQHAGYAQTYVFHLLRGPDGPA